MHFLHRLEETYPKVENDIAIRQELNKLPPLGKEPTPGELELLWWNSLTSWASFLRVP